MSIIGIIGLCLVIPFIATGLGVGLAGLVKPDHEPPPAWLPFAVGIPAMIGVILIAIDRLIYS